MYVPAHYAQADVPTLHTFIDDYPFALLISQQDGRPVATHLPLLLDRDTGPYGALIGHVARQNPQWRQFAEQQLLAIFSGPHAYISPAWYQAEKTVPTWNYVAVHVYGRATLVENPDELVELVGQLTDRFERNRPTPWTFDPAEPFVQKMSRQIVGFRIEIERIEGKWKLNQNHPVERRRRVIAALREQDGDDAIGIAGLMATELGE